MAETSPHALIAGAGIGGLTAALALAGAGLRVTLIERAPLFEDIGAGIQIPPNAARVLERLGVLERLRSSALEPQAVSLRDYRSARELARVPLEGAEARWGAPYLAVHRADLQRSLLEQVALHPAISLVTGASIAGFASGADKVSLALRRGLLRQEMSGDFLIGADGLHSLVRARMGFGPKDEPVFSGRVAYRALIDATRLPETLRQPQTRLWLGPKAHIVHYPLRSGSLVNAVAIVEDHRQPSEKQDDWNLPGDGAALTRHFARWSPLVKTLLGAADDWRVWPLFERPAAPRFADGRVAILGDAAHPMLPFLAQGAAQAVEDAAALGQVFSKDAFAAKADVAEALARYGVQRQTRSAKIVLEARRQGRIYHMSGPAALARNLVLKLSSPERLQARYDWLYGFKI